MNNKKVIVIPDKLTVAEMPDRTFELLSRVLAINEEIVKALSVPVVVKYEGILTKETQDIIKKTFEEGFV